MRNKITKLLFVGVCTASLAVLTGCTSLVCPATEPKPKPKPEPVACGEQGAVTAARAFPTGNPQTSVIQIEKVSPSPLVVGQEYTYEIHVTNLTNMTVNNVVVTEEHGDNFELRASSPQARISGDAASWNLGTMEPQGTETIKVKGVAKAPGAVEHCAGVTYESDLCMQVEAVEPMLELVKEAPSDVLLCDVITYRYVVSNPGNGIVCNVTITDNLPAGMTTVDGQKTVNVNVGNLAPGESREYTTDVKVDDTGQYVNDAVAEADAGLRDEAQATTTVHQPVLEITKTARETQYAGRPIEYEITVTNVGDSTAQNVMLADNIPANTTFVSASDGGTAAGGQVSWNLGSLTVDASKSVNLTVRATALGEARNVAMANAECADQVQASTVTTVEGVSALLLEVIDVHDPIEVGETETYEIRVTNQGSSPATNVRITAILDPTQEFVAAGGASDASYAEGTVTFTPVSTIAPKEQRTWTVDAKGTAEKDARFEVHMDSDQLTGPPVRETESTHMY